MKYKVICNKYSHAGSGFSFTESIHNTKETAEKHATEIRPHRRWAIVKEATKTDKANQEA